MIYMYRKYDDEPKVGGGLIAAFLLLLLSCLGAFAAAGGGIFEPAPPAQMMVAPGKLERVLGRDLLPQDHGHPGNALACDRVDQSGDDLQL